MTDHTTAWAPPSTHCYRLDTGLSRHEISAKWSFFERKRLDSGSVCRSVCVVCATCGWATLSPSLCLTRLSEIGLGIAFVCVACMYSLRPFSVCTCVSTMVVCWELFTIRVISCLELRVSFLFFANFLPTHKKAEVSIKFSSLKLWFFFFYYLLRWYEQGCFLALKVIWERFYSCIISIKVRQMVFGFKAVWSNLHSCCVNTFFFF